MKGLKKLCICLFALVVAVMPLSTVHAAEDNKKAEDAKNGVVQVNTVFTDDSGNKHVVCGGTGFIVGDSENTEYVITCNHIVNPDEESKNAAFAFYEIPNSDDKWSKISLSTEVVVEGDVVVGASLLNASADLDLAILQLSQPIYTRSPLTFLTEKNYDVNKLPYAITDDVYAMGYPGAISYDSEVQYYSSNQVGISAGSIVNLNTLNGIQVIENDATVGGNNCGGPLVDKNGYVIGMNLLTKDGIYSCALDSTKIAVVLDGLGVDYGKVTKVPTSADVKVPGKEDPNNPDNPDTPEKPTSIPKYFFVILCVVVVLFVLLIFTIIVLLVNKKKPEDGTEKPKKEKKKKKKDKEPSVLDRYYQQSEKDNELYTDNIMTIKYTSVDDDATTVLSGADDQTTLLSDDLNEMRGFLIRKSSGERINITKPVFTIGKDSSYSDYTIVDNKTISRQHVIIRSENGAVYIEDCKSTNGSWINGKKITEGDTIRLNNGDSIKLSDEEFEYRYS